MGRPKKPVPPLSLDFTPPSDSLFPRLQSHWIAPEKLSLSAWAEQNITLSSEYSASSAGLNLYGWQKEVWDAFTNPEVEEIVLCVAVQMMKTLFIQCALSYIVCVDPGPILVVQPNDDDARTFSKERLTPMIRDNEVLKSRLTENTQGGRDTITGKSFPGGSLSLVGSISPSNLARRSIRYLFCDEVDKYPASAKSEGNPVDLAWERTATFGSRRKRILCCSPTVAGLSLIGKMYRETDMRKPWVTCMYCGFEQILVWEQVKDITGGSFVYNHGATARYECANASCKAKWTDLERSIAADKSVWKPERPEIKGRRGYWISHLYAPWTMAKSKSLPVLAADYLDRLNDRNRLKVFKNTTLALEWEEDGEMPEHQVLYDRRESYAYGSPSTAIIPGRALFLTAAVDVQESPPRLEYEVVAWGRNRECWSIAYGSIECFADNQQPLPVTSKELWDKLDLEVLQPTWRHEHGHSLPIWLMGIDTGRRPKPVYEFARRHRQLSYSPAGYTWRATRTVVPVKGIPDAYKILSSVSKEDAARKQQGVRIIGLGTHFAKQEIYDALRYNRPKVDGTLSGSPSPGCYHHPMYSMPYFLGVCSEMRVIKDSGKVEWVQRVERNEPLDLKVYNRGMAAIAGIDRWGEQQWQDLERALGPKDKAEVMVVTTSPVKAVEEKEEQSIKPITPPPTFSTPPPVITSGHVLVSRTRGVRGGFAG